MKNLLWVSVILFLVSMNAWPAESWLCVEDSSQVQGSRILACGVGEGKNESQARKKAFESAKEEFSSICGSESACGKYEYSTTPSRSTCQNTDGQWVCHRLVVYEITETKREQHNEQNIESKSVQNHAPQYVQYNLNVRDDIMDMQDEIIRKQLNGMR